MTTLPVTSVFAALAAIALAVLGLWVASYRMRAQISYGDKEDKVLRKRIRVHGNFIEYVPVALIVLGLIEFSGAPKWQVWALGGALAVARLSHVAGLVSGVLPFRATGATLTFLMLAVSGVVLLWRVL